MTTNWCSVVKGEGEHEPHELGLAAGTGFGEDAFDVKASGFQGQAKFLRDLTGFQALKQGVGDARFGWGEGVEGAQDCASRLRTGFRVADEDEGGELGGAAGELRDEWRDGDTQRFLS